MIVRVGAGHEIADLATRLANRLNREVVASTGLRADTDLDPEHVVIADLAEDLSTEDTNLLKAAVARDCSLVLRNATGERVSDFAVVGVDARTVVIKNVNSGRRQQIIVAARDDHVFLGEPEESSQELTASDEDLRAGSRKLGIVSIARGRDAHDALELSQDTETVRPQEETVTHRETGLTEEEELERISAWLQDDSFHRSHARKAVRGNDCSAASPPMENLSASEAYAEIIFSETRWNPLGRDQQASYWGSFDIHIYATMKPKKKFVKLTSVGSAVSMPGGMGEDSSHHRGSFTLSGRMWCWPGDTCDLFYDFGQVVLPPGWRRIHIEPQTPNQETTYTKTTGWSVTAKGGGEIAKDPKVALNLEASYSESNTESATIRDFRVKNSSTAAVCAWTYEYSRYCDGLENMFDQPFLQVATVKGIAPLAKSTMFMENEAVYEVPADTTTSQPFAFKLQHDSARLCSEGTVFVEHCWGEEHYSWYWDFISVNLGMVRHPTE